MPKPRAGRRHWLFKTEPDVYSIEDLAREGSTLWDGVRNYQARNLLRDDLQLGDGVFIYHSSCERLGIAGLATVTGVGIADPSAFDPASPYHDPKSRPAAPTWYCVEIAFERRFTPLIARDAIAAEPGLAAMVLLQRGSRLSIQPVGADEARRLLQMAQHEAEA
ncbi:MAG: EVE domain-containing protein [Planctomycetes bacterium]|nr:EVE domain-containing protein [Planctomycetota bacterium]